MKKKICKKCKQEIKKKEKFVLLGTYEDKKVWDESFFHFKCFVEFYNKKVEEKARNIVQGMQKTAQGLLGNIINNVGNFQGADQLGSMLNIDLNKEIPKEDLGIEDNKKKKKKKRFKLW